MDGSEQTSPPFNDDDGFRVVVPSASPPLFRPRPQRPIPAGRSQHPTTSSSTSSIVGGGGGAVSSGSPRPRGGGGPPDIRRWNSNDSDTMPGSPLDAAQSSSSSLLSMSAQASTLSHIYAPLSRRRTEVQERPGPPKWAIGGGDEDDDDDEEEGDDDDDDDGGVFGGAGRPNLSAVDRKLRRFASGADGSPSSSGFSGRESGSSVRTALAGRPRVGSGRQSSGRRTYENSSSSKFAPQMSHSKSLISSVLSSALRGPLLFAIGLAYGLFMKELLQLPQTNAEPHSGFGLLYIVGWGVAGVGLGNLMPLVDAWLVEERGEATASEERERKSERLRHIKSPEDGSQEKTDGLESLRKTWSDVVRSVGAFVGIAFAIRKTPWQSTHQLSLTLAIANQALWYLLDRSRSGFALAALTGVLGSASLLLTHSEEVVPLPASWTTSTGSGAPTLHDTHRSTYFSGSGRDAVSAFGMRNGRHGLGTDRLVMTKRLGAVDVNIGDSISIAAWIAGVFFCTCICFGSIGRRLALTGRQVEEWRL